MCHWVVASLIVLACGGRSRGRDHRDDGGHSRHSFSEAGVDGGSTKEDAGQHSGEPSSDSTLVTYETGDASSGASGSSDVAATTQTETVGTTAAQSTESGSSPQTSETSDAITSDSAASGSSGDSSVATSEPAPIVLPEGCAAQTHSEVEKSCFLNTLCTGGGSDLTMCSRLPSGRWQCGCEFNNTDRQYEVDAPGANPCAVASRFCGEDTLELGEEECEPVGQSDDDSCSLTLSCGRPIEGEFEPGTAVRLMDVTTSECVRLSDGSFDCDCSHLDTDGRHGVISDSATNACLAVAQFCRGTASTPLEGPEVCVTDSASSNTDGCELIETCTTPVAVVADLPITDIEPRGAYCSPSGPGTSQCYCSDLNSSFSFQVATAEGSCETTSSSCRPDVDIQPQGEPTCEMTSEYSSAGDCHADLDCAQPAAVDGREVMADGRLLVWCRQAAFGESWWCGCASDQESAIFEYGAPDAHPQDVCLAAAEGCMEHLDVHLGAYGEFKPVVDPLSMLGSE